LNLLEEYRGFARTTITHEYIDNIKYEDMSVPVWDLNPQSECSSDRREHLSSGEQPLKWPYIFRHKRNLCLPVTRR
jgi:hypothetical protein